MKKLIYVIVIFFICSCEDSERKKMAQGRVVRLFFQKIHPSLVIVGNIMSERCICKKENMRFLVILIQQDV